jgi:hypothetical protein
MIKEQDGICCESDVLRVIVVERLNNCAYEGARKETHPESRETGPPMQSPPRSKYLKHPVRRIAR